LRLEAERFPAKHEAVRQLVPVAAIAAGVRRR
jgi:hypothetical protein